MAEGFDDIEMGNLGEKCPEYKDTDYDELNTKYNELLKYENNLVTEFEANREGNFNHQQWLDTKSRIEHIKKLMDMKKDTRERGPEEISFTDNDDGKTVTIRGAEGREVTAPAVSFVDMLNYKDVSNENYELALFREAEEIRRRLNNLPNSERQLAENEVRRVQLINKKIEQLYKKRLGNDPASRDIVKRT